MEAQVRQSRAKYGEIAAQDGELQILVPARLDTMPEIERPAADDAPRTRDAGEAAVKVAGVPC